jgi:hypothetical protein
MNDKRWKATLRALARHALHIPDEHHVDVGAPGRPGWIQVGGICPASLMKARPPHDGKPGCSAAVYWWFKETDPIGDCDVCDTEDD